jgi:hypothetical protein
MFSNPLFNNILNEIERESTNEKKCLISRLDIHPYNSITLPCNHGYRVEYFRKLIRKNPLKCPYCSLNVDSKLIVKQCSHLNNKTSTQCTKTTLCDSGFCMIHGKPKCIKILKNGNRCTKNEVKNGMCNLHNCTGENLNKII